MCLTGQGHPQAIAACNLPGLGVYGAWPRPSRRPRPRQACPAPGPEAPRPSAPREGARGGHEGPNDERGHGDRGEAPRGGETGPGKREVHEAGEAEAAQHPACSAEEAHDAREGLHPEREVDRGDEEDKDAHPAVLLEGLRPPRAGPGQRGATSQQRREVAGHVAEQAVEGQDDERHPQRVGEAQHAPGEGHGLVRVELRQDVVGRGAPEERHASHGDDHVGRGQNAERASVDDAVDRVLVARVHLPIYVQDAEVAAEGRG
mmetsp:Transcript_46676/g.137896  ORF Transcript_46676/g.137896 Transcript_46676/m.137896 type:complete len:261 (-) Transcript_46676:759-1541(-)